MSIYSRRQIASLFCSMVAQHPRRHAIEMTAVLFGQSAETVERVLVDAAVTEYLHAVGLTHEPALSVVIAAAAKYRLTTDELQVAIDDHLLSVEVL